MELTLKGDEKLIRQTVKVKSDTKCVAYWSGRMTGDTARTSSMNHV